MLIEIYFQIFSPVLKGLYCWELNPCDCSIWNLVLLENELRRERKSFIFSVFLSKVWPVILSEKNCVNIYHSRIVYQTFQNLL